MTQQHEALLAYHHSRSLLLLEPLVLANMMPVLAFHNFGMTAHMKWMTLQNVERDPPGPSQTSDGYVMVL